MKKLLALALGFALATNGMQAEITKDNLKTVRQAAAAVATGTTLLVTTSKGLQLAKTKGLMTEDTMMPFVIANLASNHIYNLLASALEDGDSYMKLTNVLSTATMNTTSLKEAGFGALEQVSKELGHMLVDHFNKLDKRIHRRIVRTIAYAVIDALAQNASALIQGKSFDSILKPLIESAIFNTYYEVAGEVIAQLIEKDAVCSLTAETVVTEGTSAAVTEEAPAIA